MSLYDTPRSGRAASEPDDDAAARIGFTSRRRTDFDIEGALAAGRRSPAPGRRPRRGGLEAPPSGRANLWLPLGPTDMFAPPYDSRQRNAGRIKMLDVHPNGDRVYAASGNGGVWFSPDGGANWTSLGGFAATNAGEINRPAQRHATGAIFVDFKASAALDEVYVGTGEPSHKPEGQPGGSLGGIGVLVATGPANAGPNDNPWVREAKELLGFGCSRFAMQPGGSTIVVATTAGLFQRPAVGGVDAVWTKVAGSPFSALSNDCTDVLWTPSNGTTPERLWVWVKDGVQSGLWVRDAGATDFTQIPTTTSDLRGVLAASTPPTQVFVFNDRDAGVLPRLYRVSSPADIPVSIEVTAGVPDMVGNQGFYDMSIAVHPTQPNRVVLTGNTFDHLNIHAQAIGSYGSIIVGDVADNAGTLTFGHPTAPTTIGVGVHSDVHYVRYSNNGARLWATCDGGVYRSDKPDQPAGFVPRNNGLAVAESNYLVCHPVSEGYIVTGLQDNGVIERRSNGVWPETDVGGDGGGVAFDPLTPDRFFRQHSTNQWSTSDGTLQWNHFPNAGEPIGAFYSTPAAIAHRRGVVAPAAPNVSQLIFGTRRVWYSEDFGATWTTLPSGGPDPLLTANTTRDDFGEKITVCRWQHPDVAWILGEHKLQRYARTAGSDSGGGPGTWAPPADVIRKNVKKNKKDNTSAEGPIRESAIWTDIAVNLDPDANGDGYGEQFGTLGALYMGTVGNADNAGVDTLWWFNGTDTWFPTGLRAAVPAPVTAIVCDAAHPEEVYVGTTVGTWRGIRTLNGNNPPTWVFEARNIGLPEAAVEDLQVFSHGGLRLLRAAIAARGVWELRLDVTDVTDLTYVRAHGDDLRYRLRSIEVKRDTTTVRSWHASPDVRPRRAPRDLAAPGNLPWTKGMAGIVPEALRQFQMALRSKTGDLRVRPDGKWDDYFNEVLRDLGAPVSGAPNHVVSITDTFWNNTLQAPHTAAEAWTTAVPTEADLFDFTAPLDEGEIAAVSCALPARSSKVEVVVHHRGLDQMDGANVRVTLLKWLDPKVKKTAKFDDSTTWFSGNVPWTAAVNEVLNSPGGTTSQAFGGGWSFVGSSAAARRKTLTGQTLHNMRAGIATFDLDLSGLRANRVILLVAVIRVGVGATNDSNLAAAELKELALTNPHVAVRSMRIGT